MSGHDESFEVVKQMGGYAMMVRILLVLVLLCGSALAMDDLSKMTDAELDAYIQEKEARIQALKQGNNDEGMQPLINPNTQQQQSEPRPYYRIPNIEEFYVEITPRSTVLGAMFGKLKKQRKQIEEYWLQRKQRLDAACAECLALDSLYVQQCLDDVRATQEKESNAIRQNEYARAQAAYYSTLYMQNAFMQAGQQMQQNAQQQQNRQQNINCYTYGNMTNCSSY